MAEASPADPRWLRVKELFDEAVGQPPAGLPAWLDARCGGDADLQRQVESLIAAHRAAGDFIESPAIAALGAARAVADAVAVQAGADPIGHRLGAYRVVGELARGGMGVVYLAERDDDAFRKRVAIKMMRGGLNHPALAARFEAERRILASLEHPNIARLLDAGTDEHGTPFVVMEYVEGTPIDAYVSERRLPIRQRLELFCTVCDAVQYSHQRLVVHRDIKPGNILVTGDGVPKLLDFGIAKLLDAAEGRADATRTEFRALTPDSASPEQVRGDPVTVASDVYSLGVLVYRLLTGRSPYRSSPRTDTEIVRAICEEEPPKPSDTVAAGVDGTVQPPTLSPRELTAKRRELAGDLDLITLKALRKEPERRYTSVERFAEDVRRHLRGEPVEAVPDSWRYRAGRFLRRHRAGVTGAVVLAFVIGAGLAGTLWEARVARIERERAVRRFNDVRGLARSVMFELHDAIEPLPGSTAARALLVRRALGYLDRLAAEGGGDVSLQRELAEGYLRIGDVQGNAGKDNLGQTSDALGSDRKALAILERVSSAAPGDAEVLDDLARAHAAVGLQLSAVGDQKSALGHLRTAVAIRTRLADAHPDDPRRQVALGWSYQSLGDVLAALEDWPQLLEIREKALDPIRRAAERSPGDAPLQRSLALAYKRLGAIQAKLDRFGEGLETDRKALAIDEASLAASPGSTIARMDLSMSVSEVGYMLWKTGDLRAALAHYARARAIREELVRADPNDKRPRLALAGTISRTAWIRRDLKDYDGWIADSRAAVSLFDGLAARDPKDVAAQSLLAHELENLGDAYQAAAAHARTDPCRDARTHFIRALAMYREMASRHTLTGSNVEAPGRVEAKLARCR